MAFVPTPNCALVSLAYDWKGQKCNNTLWFENGGTPFDAGRLLDLGNAINSYWVGSVMTQLSQDIVFRGCIVYAQDSESAPAVDVPVTPFAGEVVADSLPNNVAWCVKFTTTGRGKSYRGRNYVPGIPDNVYADNAVNSTWAGNVRDAYYGILTETGLATFAWVVVSHFTAGAPRAAGLVSSVVNVSYSDLVIDSQRRRLPGRGT